MANLDFQDLLTLLKRRTMNKHTKFEENRTEIIILSLLWLYIFYCAIYLFTWYEDSCMKKEATEGL